MDKVYAFGSEEGFARSVRSIRKSETDVGSNRVPRESPPVPSQLLIYLTKNDSGSTWSKGNSYDMNVYYGDTQGSEPSCAAQTGGVLSNVYVRLGDIANGKWAYILEINSRLEVWAAEC